MSDSPIDKKPPLLTIRHKDGSKTIVRDELQYQRILNALRKPGKPYVHIREKK